MYFKPFYFKNGNPCKPKYFIVLKVLNGTSVVASLPTRKDHIPEKEVIESGCVELPDINLNCFVIGSKQIITTCHKSFDFKTYIYGHQLDTHELADMQKLYKIEDVEYEVFGEMIPDVFRGLIDCLKSSKSVRNKYLKVL